MIVLLGGASFAGELLVWEREDFGPEGPLAGADGWEGGFAEDPWRSSGARAYTESDLTADEAPGATDNWLLRGAEVGQGGVEATFDTDDDDTMGVVLGHDGEGTFYLAGFTRDEAPPPVGRVAGPTLFLVKVTASVPTLVDAWQGDPGLGEHTIRLERDDDRVWVSLDGLLLVQANDPAPLPPGRAGLYAYTAGEDFPWLPFDEDTPAWFERLRVFAWDEDDDGVHDDLDDCETVADPDQLDADGDGVGDLCDETPGTEPEGEEPPTTATGGEEPEAPEPEDTVLDELAGSVDDPHVVEGLRPVSGCGCGHGGMGGAWLVAAGLLARRRR